MHSRFETEEHDQEALIKLYLLKQTAEELVVDFRFLARQAGLGFRTHQTTSTWFTYFKTP